jgi:hypothetical protein
MANEKASFEKKRPRDLIVFQEQNRLGTSVCFRDDPKFDSLGGAICREEA